MQRKFRILTMPDLFLDHLLIAGRKKKFLDSLGRTASIGTRMRVAQKLVLGGNAYYFGKVMAQLGCSVTLVARTSDYMLGMLREEVSGLDFSTSFVEGGHEPSLTTAIEFSGRGKSASLNLNHPGSLEHFGRNSFPGAVAGSSFDLVSVFNFTNNSDGPDLAAHVFASFGGIKLMDLPDPASSFSDAEGLCEALCLTDFVSCTPAEARFACALLGLGENLGARKAALALSRLGPGVAVHSASACLEVSGGEVVSAKVQPLDVRSTTGAGDCWTASYAYSLLNGYSPRKRLEFAIRNTSAFLVERMKGVPP